MNNVKMFRLKIRLQEIIIDEGTILFPIFTGSQTILGIDQIKSALDVLNKQAHEFINSVLIPNNKRYKNELH